MKKIGVMLLALLLLTGCGLKTDDKSNDTYNEGYNEGYSEGYNAGVQEEKDTTDIEENVRIAKFSGAFTATVEKLIPDYCALPGNTIAVVHFFQSMPFLIQFHEDMTGKLEEGETYVFEFEPFQVVVVGDDEHPQINNYMYQINVVSFRIAKEDEIGLESICADVSFEQEDDKSSLVSDSDGSQGNVDKNDYEETSTGFADGQIQRECVMVNDEIYMYGGKSIDKLPEHFSIVLKIEKVDDYNLPSENLSACHMDVGTVIYASEQSKLCIYVESDDGRYIKYDRMSEEVKQQLLSNE